MLADAEVGTLDDIVDMGAYPLDAVTAMHELAAEVRCRLARDGAITLPGFLRTAALESIADELERAREHVTIRCHRGTVYARTELEAELAADDPRRVQLEWTAGHVTRDMIPAQSPAHCLYVSPVFKRFIAD